MRSFRTAEFHTAGEPFRIVTDGVPDLEGTTVLDKRAWCQEHLDSTRALLINEPRGHADMYGGFPTSPDDSDGDLGVVFFHKDGFSTACGHGTIALVTWAIESGRLPATNGEEIDVVVDVPSGRLRTRARVGADGQVEAVKFWNVPAFVTGHALAVPTSLGLFTATVSYGGAYYASVGLDTHALSPDSASLTDLISLGREIKALLATHQAVKHPTDGRLSGLYGVIFHQDVTRSPLHQRNVTVFADGEVDRSPCGSGTSARLAVLHHDGVLGVGETLLNEGIAGGQFSGCIVEETEAGVVTSVEGTAYKTGEATFSLDPRDPLGSGFQLR